MIDREHGLAVSKQATILNISRGSVYYRPRPVPGRDLRLYKNSNHLTVAAR
jgi:putative transposase